MPGDFSPYPKRELLSIAEARRALKRPNGSTPEGTAAVISQIERFLQRFIILPKSAYLPVSVLFAATHLAKSFAVFPYLLFTSPEPECGKTLMLDLARLLCARAILNISPSPAALYRMMEDTPTLLLDEVDMLFKSKGPLSETQQAIIAIANSGYKKGATVPRVERNGKGKFEVQYYPVYGPKIFAAIGPLPRTITTRALSVRMQRKGRGEEVEWYLAPVVEPQGAALRADIERWARAHDKEVAATYRGLYKPESIAGLKGWLNNRDAEIWIPLLAVCAVAEPDRLADLKKAAVALGKDKRADAADDSVGLRLLRDIRLVWPQGAANILTKTLIEKLEELEESPWKEWEFNDRKIAKVLGDYQIRSQSVRAAERNGKGYRHDDFVQVWAVSTPLFVFPSGFKRHMRHNPRQH